VADMKLIFVNQWKKPCGICESGNLEIKAFHLGERERERERERRKRRRRRRTLKNIT